MENIDASCSNAGLATKYENTLTGEVGGSAECGEFDWREVTPMSGCCAFELDWADGGAFESSYFVA